MDERSMAEVQIVLDGWDENMRLEWEMTRAVCFNVAKFGNSDPKKFPKSPERFWPFTWDKKESPPDVQTLLTQHARKVALRDLIEKQMKEPQHG